MNWNSKTVPLMLPIAFLGTLATVPAVAQSLPVAHYSFDAPGDPGQDSAGGLDATSVVNISQVPGVSGLAGSFSQGYMQLPGVALLDLLAGDFTLSLWIRSDSFTSGNWFTKATTSSHRYGFGGPRGVFDGDGLALGYASFFFNGSAAFGGVQSSTVVFDGEWHHLAGVKRALTAEIWVDGVRQLRPPGPINWNDVIDPSFPDDGSFAIGRAGACCESFIGEMDEAKIWDSALSPQEIRSEAGVGCPGPSDVDYQGFTAADCAAPQSTIAVFDQSELDAYMVDFGFDGLTVKNLNVKFNPIGEVVVVSPCEVNLAGLGGYLDIAADRVCVYGRKGVTVAQDASSPDRGITAEEVVLVSEEGSAGFSQGLELISDAILVRAKMKAKVGLGCTVDADTLELVSTGDTNNSNAIIRQGSEVTGVNVLVSGSRGATIGNGVEVTISGDLVLESTGSAVKSVAAVKLSAFVTAGQVSQRSGNKASVGKNAIVQAAGEYHMEAPTCSIAASAAIGGSPLTGNCLE